MSGAARTFVVDRPEQAAPGTPRTPVTVSCRQFECYFRHQVNRFLECFDGHFHQGGG